MWFSMLILFGFSMESAKAATTFKPATYMGVKVNADTPLEQYLALKMLKAESEIVLTNYKEIKDFNYLMDRVEKVVNQNPLILGASEFQYVYSSKMKKLKVVYAYDKKTIIQRQKEMVAKAKSITKSIIKNGMSEEEKHKAIYLYLENNARYDDEAASNFSTSISNISGKYKDSYTAYEVLIKKTGVCMSYSGAYKLLSDIAGLNSVVVTGYLGTTPHSWNKIKLGNEWVHVDPTNNFKTSGIPFLLFGANDIQASKQGYTIDNRFWLDNEMTKFNSKLANNDYYVKNKLEVRDLEEFKKVVSNSLNKDMISVRFVNNYDRNVIADVVMEVLSEDERAEDGVQMMFLKNYVLIMP